MSYDLSKKNSQSKTNHIIDLRSDTVTKPSIEMRKIMAGTVSWRWHCKGLWIGQY